MIRDLIKKHEGYSNVPYKCPAGKNTIGWGHNFDANPLPKDIQGYLFANGFILPEHAERLLTEDINSAENDCRSLYPGFDSFSETRKAGLVNFVFNVGSPTAKTFKKMIKAIIGRDWDRAALEMKDSAWFSQVGKRSIEIVKMVREG